MEKISPIFDENSGMEWHSWQSDGGESADSFNFIQQSTHSTHSTHSTQSIHSTQPTPRPVSPRISAMSRRSLPVLLEEPEVPEKPWCRAGPRRSLRIPFANYRQDGMYARRSLQEGETFAVRNLITREPREASTPNNVYAFPHERCSSSASGHLSFAHANFNDAFTTSETVETEKGNGSCTNGVKSHADFNCNSEDEADEITLGGVLGNDSRVDLLLPGTEGTWDHHKTAENSHSDCQSARTQHKSVYPVESRLGPIEEFLASADDWFTDCTPEITGAYTHPGLDLDNSGAFETFGTTKQSNLTSSRNISPVNTPGRRSTWSKLFRSSGFFSPAGPPPSRIHKSLRRRRSFLFFRSKRAKDLSIDSVRNSRTASPSTGRIAKAMGVLGLRQLDPRFVSQLVHEITARLLSADCSLSHVFLPATDASQAVHIRSFLECVFQSKSKLLEGPQLRQELLIADVHTLMGALRWIWSRLPRGVISWQSYHRFLEAERQTGDSATSYQDLFMKCFETQASYSVAHDFLTLLYRIASEEEENSDLSKDKMKVSGVEWAFLAGVYAFPLTDATEDVRISLKSAIHEWTRAFNACFHLFYSFLRSQPGAGGKSGSQFTFLRLPSHLLRITEQVPYNPSEFSVESVCSAANLSFISLQNATGESSMSGESLLRIVAESQNVQFDSHHVFTQQDRDLFYACFAEPEMITEMASKRSLYFLNQLSQTKKLVKKRNHHRMSYLNDSFDESVAWDVDFSVLSSRQSMRDLNMASVVSPVDENKFWLSVEKLEVTKLHIWAWFMCINHEQPLDMKSLVSNVYFLELDSKWLPDSFQSSNEWIVVEENVIKEGKDGNSDMEMTSEDKKNHTAPHNVLDRLKAKFVKKPLHHISEVPTPELPHQQQFMEVETHDITTERGTAGSIRPPPGGFPSLDPARATANTVVETARYHYYNLGPEGPLLDPRAQESKMRQLGISPVIIQKGVFPGSEKTSAKGPSAADCPSSCEPQDTTSVKSKSSKRSESSVNLKRMSLADYSLYLTFIESGGTEQELQETLQTTSRDLGIPTAGTENHNWGSSGSAHSIRSFSSIDSASSSSGFRTCSSIQSKGSRLQNDAYIHEWETSEGFVKSSKCERTSTSSDRSEHSSLSELRAQMTKCSLNEYQESVSIREAEIRDVNDMYRPQAPIESAEFSSMSERTQSMKQNTSQPSTQNNTPIARPVESSDISLSDSLLHTPLVTASKPRESKEHGKFALLLRKTLHLAIKKKTGSSVPHVKASSSARSPMTAPVAAKPHYSHRTELRQPSSSTAPSASFPEPEVTAGTDTVGFKYDRQDKSLQGSQTSFPNGVSPSESVGFSDPGSASGISVQKILPPLVGTEVQSTAEVPAAAEEPENPIQSQCMAETAVPSLSRPPEIAAATEGELKTPPMLFETGTAPLKAPMAPSKPAKLPLAQPLIHNRHNVYQPPEPRSQLTQQQFTRSVDALPLPNSACQDTVKNRQLEAPFDMPRKFGNAQSFVGMSEAQDPFVDSSREIRSAPGRQQFGLEAPPSRDPRRLEARGVAPSGMMQYNNRSMPSLPLPPASRERHEFAGHHNDTQITPTRPLRQAAAGVPGQPPARAIKENVAFNVTQPLFQANIGPAVPAGPVRGYERHVAAGRAPHVSGDLNSKPRAGPSSLQQGGSLQLKVVESSPETLSSKGTRSSGSAKSNNSSITSIEESPVQRLPGRVAVPQCGYVPESVGGFRKGKANQRNQLKKMLVDRDYGLYTSANQL